MPNAVITWYSDATTWITEWPPLSDCQPPSMCHHCQPKVVRLVTTDSTVIFLYSCQQVSYNTIILSDRHINLVLKVCLNLNLQERPIWAPFFLSTLCNLRALQRGGSSSIIKICCSTPQCNKWPWVVELQNTQDIHWFLRPSLASLNDYVKWRKQQEERQQRVGYQAGHSQTFPKNYPTWKHFAEFIWGQCYYYFIEKH